jgi:hypothetical protein
MSRSYFAPAHDQLSRLLEDQVEQGDSRPSRRGSGCTALTEGDAMLELSFGGRVGDVMTTLVAVTADRPLAVAPSRLEMDCDGRGIVFFDMTVKARCGGVLPGLPDGRARPPTRRR